MTAAMSGGRLRTWARRSLICALLLGTALVMSWNNSSQVYVQSVFAVVTMSLLLAIELPALFRQRRLRVAPLFWALLASVVVAAASLVESEDPLTSLKAIVPMALFMLYAWVLSNTVTEMREVYLYLGCIALTVVVTSGYGLLQFIGVLPGSVNAPSGAEAVLSTFGQRAFLAAFAAAGAVVSLALVLSPRLKAPFRVAAGLSTVLPLLLLAAVVQRGAMLALIAGLATLGLVWAIAVRRARRSETPAAAAPRRRWLVFGVGGLVLAVGAGVVLLLTTWSGVVSWRPSGGPFQPAVGRWQANQPATVALFDVATGKFFFENRSNFDTHHPGSLPVVGDWNGDGIDDPGVYEPRSGHFTLFIPSAAEPIARDIHFGTPGAKLFPLAGDWVGDGISGIGLYDPADSSWRLRNTPTEGPADRTLAFGTGQAHCDALVGDWNGSGTTMPGVYDYFNKRFYLLQAWPEPGARRRRQETVSASYWRDGDLLVAGRFTQTPAAGLGTFRPSNLLVSIDRYRTGKADVVSAWGRGSWGEFVQRRALRAQSYVGDLRLADWLIAVDMLFDHPSLGIGIANYKLRFTDYMATFLSRPAGRPYLEREFPRAEQAHNDFIQWIAETGLVGGLALLLASVLFAATALRGLTVASPEQRVLRIALFAGAVAVLADALTLFPLHLPATALLAATACGLLYAPALLPEARSYHPARKAAFGVSIVVLPVVVILLFACWRDYTADQEFVFGRRALLQRDNASAKAHFQRSYLLGLPSPGQVPYHLGTIAEAENDAVLADAYFDIARERLPSPVAYLKSAQYNIRAGRTARARQLLDVIVHLSGPKDSLNIQARILESNLEVAAKRPAVAESILRGILQDTPETVTARLALAYLLNDQDRRAEALDQVTIALQQVDQQVHAQRLAVAALEQRQTVSSVEAADALGKLDQLERTRQAVRTALEFIKTGVMPAQLNPAGSSDFLSPPAEPQ